jgi:hypothetical protein
LPLQKFKKRKGPDRDGWKMYSMIYERKKGRYGGRRQIIEKNGHVV